MKQVLANMEVYDACSEIIYYKDFLTPNDVNAACQLFSRPDYRIVITFLPVEPNTQTSEA